MASVTLRAEFSLFADNTVLGPSFTLNGFEFRDVAKPVSFVNESGGQKGLQFGHPGVQVKLPVETGLVNVRAAAFAGAFRILGRNAAGSTVAVETIPGDNTPHVVQLIHPGLASLDFRGGSNEG
ncbi:MAG TPA: hypothetical protein VHK90_16120, partial [Thermoanaerobaculia bacterium]|nr:hypothetical protein [Thermoanaerobaculia bacterium]